MGFVYENQGSNTYLVYEVESGDSIDSLSLGMLTNNKIPGLAQTMFTQMDTNKYIKFNVSAKISVAQFFASAVSRKRLLGVFSGIVDAMLSAEDYMLPSENILLDTNYIYADVSTCETVLVCLPIERTVEDRVDVGMFFKNIVFSTQFDQTENCDYVARIINYLNSSISISLEDFKKLLDELKGDVNVAVATPTPVQQVVVQPVATPAQEIAMSTVSQSAELNVVTPPQQPSIIPSASTAEKMTKVQPVVVPSVESSTQNTPQSNEKGLFGKLFKKKDAEQNVKKDDKGVKATKASAAPLPPPFPGQPMNAPSVATKEKKENKKSFSPKFAIPGQPVPTSQPAAASVPTPNSVATSVPTPTPASQPAYTPMPQQMNFGETTVLGGGAIGETTVLSAASPVVQKDNPHLICKKNGEKIPLNKPIFRIGKERSYVDYFIGDNTAISRSHANIVTRDGEYFIVDTNSTNHTYLNDAMIQSNIEVKISHGDKIRLANEDFEFKIR